MRLFKLLAAVVLASVLTSAPSSASDAGFHRGINIHTAMNWAILDRSSGRYTFPPFATESYQLTDAELQALGRAGFDFVRLTVDPGPFLQYEGYERDALDAILLDRVHSIMAAGLSVIVDFHPNMQNESYRVENYVRAPQDPFVAAFAVVLTRTARLLGELKTDRVALELLNEPWTSGVLASLHWQRTLEAYHAAARRGSATLQLILSGGDGGSAQGLIDVDPTAFRGSNVVFTFHCYTPLPFTMQGEAGPKIMDLAEVPYPLDSRPSDATLSGIRAHIDATTDGPDAKDKRFYVAKGYLEWIMSRGPVATTPGRSFADVAEWADRNHIPHDRILLGEFGVARNVGPHRGAPEPDRLRWLTEMRETAERYGMPWAYWSYRSYSGMMLVREPGSDDFDDATLKVLGLRTTNSPPSSVK